MTKISLVQLSQLERKPKKVKLDDNIFEYDYNNEIYFDGYNLINENILFSDFNEPLIEIVEEPLLTDDEKDLLKLFLKIDSRKFIEISKTLYWIYSKDENGQKDTLIQYQMDYFKGLEESKSYSLEELGLYDE